VTEFTPRQIIGRWREGFSLDLHTLRSFFVGDDEFGHPRFETERSAIGELLYRLKYAGDRAVIPEIVGAVGRFMSEWHPMVDILVPVPSSTHRAVQPVLALADAIGEQLGIPVHNCVTRDREAP
jgi:competence protein ComFC